MASGMCLADFETMVHGYMVPDLVRPTIRSYSEVVSEKSALHDIESGRTWLAGCHSALLISAYSSRILSILTYYVETNGILQLSRACFQYRMLDVHIDQSHPRLSVIHVRSPSVAYRDSVLLSLETVRETHIRHYTVHLNDVFIKYLLCHAVPYCLRFFPGDDGQRQQCFVNEAAALEGALLYFDYELGTQCACSIRRTSYLRRQSSAFTEDTLSTCPQLDRTSLVDLTAHSQYTKFGFAYADPELITTRVCR